MRAVALADILQDARPGFASGKSDPDGIIQIRMNNVSVDGAFSLDAIRRVPRAETDLHRFAVSPGDILFNATNSPELVGKSALFPGHSEPVVYSNHFLRLRVRPERADSSYVARWLHAVRRRGVFTGMCKQWVNQATVPADRLLDMPVPLPLLTEQRRIAAILDQADALRAKRRAALARLDEMARATFVEMFGDAARNPKGWPTTTLGHLVASGPQNGIYKPASAYGDGTPILRIDSFYDGALVGLAALKRVRVSNVERDLYGLRSDDIVVNRVNSMEYLGKSALIPILDEPTIFESNMMRFAVDRARAEPRYIVQFLQTSFVKDQIRAAAKHAVNQSSINQQDVTGFQVLCPPLGLQQQFCQRFSKLTELQAQQRASLAYMSSLFASLQHRAFREEL